MKICHLLSHDRVKSGGAIQALLLARAQRRRGHEVRLVFNAGRQPDEARRAFAPLAEEGFDCHALPMQHLARFAGRRRLRRLLDESTPDVLHAHRERALRFALAALSGRDRPALIAQKGNCYRSDARTAAAFRSPRLDRIVAVAGAVKKVLVLHDGVPPEKVEVVYGSFDPARFSERRDPAAARRALDLPPDVPLVGLLANLDRKKGHRLFFEAAARVARVRGDARFVAIGGGDVDRARAEAAEAGAGGVVTFAGFRPDAEVALSALDVSVNCSKDGEGLTGAIRESMALGVPVVCTNVAGNSEIVENGVTGLLVPPRDPERLAAAIVAALADPEAAARRAAEGRRRVRATMDDEVRADRVLALYEEVLRWRRPTLAERGIEGCLHPDVETFRAPGSGGG